MSTQMDAMQELGPVPNGFNWGAFLFTGIFLLFNRRVGTALLLFFGGAFLGAVLGDASGLVLGAASLLISLYFGFAAKQIAWETRRYASYAQLDKSMRRWNVAAVVFGVLLVGLIAMVALDS
jgi:hypothetical protein